MMNRGFTKGLLIGSLIGASVSMMMNPDNMRSRNKKKMVRAGRSLFRKSGNILGDVAELFR